MQCPAAADTICSLLKVVHKKLTTLFLPCCCPSLQPVSETHNSSVTISITSNYRNMGKARKRLPIPSVSRIRNVQSRLTQFLYDRNQGLLPQEKKKQGCWTHALRSLKPDLKIFLLIQQLTSKYYTLHFKEVIYKRPKETIKGNNTMTYCLTLASEHT